MKRRVPVLLIMYAAANCMVIAGNDEKCAIENISLEWAISDSTTIEVLTQKEQYMCNKVRIILDGLNNISNEEEINVDCNKIDSESIQSKFNTPIEQEDILYEFSNSEFCTCLALVKTGYMLIRDNQVIDYVVIGTHH